MDSKESVCSRPGTPQTTAMYLKYNNIIICACYYKSWYYYQSIVEYATSMSPSIICNKLMPYLVLDILSEYPGLPGLFVAAAYSGTLRFVLC